MPKPKWVGTAFTHDSEENYAVSFQADAVKIERDHGQITVTLTDKHRRAYFVLPEEALENETDDFDFG